MSGFFHGVTTTLIDTGARTISLPSSSIIGLCDTFTPGVLGGGTAKAGDLVLLTSEREAIAAFGADSAITKAAQAIYVRAKAVIVAVGVAKLEDAALQTSAIIGGVLASGQRTGLQALLDGKSKHNAQPKLIIAPKHSATQAVATAMDALAAKLRAIAIIDGPNTTDEAALAYAEEFGSKRLYLVDPGVKYWDTTTSATVDAPGSAWAAGMFAWTDATYGYWASPSNKELVGITGTSRPIEYLDGDDTCRANLLNNANITTIIRDDGFRLWGNRTLSSDQKWAFLCVVRTADMINESILVNHLWAVDRGITKNYVTDVTEGVNAYLRSLVNKGAILGGECWIDPDLNTADQIAQGNIYFDFDFTPVYPAEHITFRSHLVNDYITEIF